MTWRVIVGTLSLVITMILLGYVAVTEPDRMANFALAYDARQVEVGAMLFESNCATCHGLNGQGVPAKGPALNTPELFNGTRLKEAGFAGSTENFVRLTIAAASKPLVRLSMPRASGRPMSAPSGNGASKSLSSSRRGRLSTTSHPMSSNVLSAVDFPAPDRPETRRIVLGFCALGIFANVQAKCLQCQFDLYGR